MSLCTTGFASLIANGPLALKAWYLSRTRDVLQ